MHVKHLLPGFSLIDLNYKRPTDIVLLTAWNRRSHSAELDQVQHQCCNLRQNRMSIQNSEAEGQQQQHQGQQQWRWNGGRTAAGAATATAVGAEQQRHQWAISLVSILAQWTSGFRQNQNAWGSMTLQNCKCICEMIAPDFPKIHLSGGRLRLTGGMNYDSLHGQRYKQTRSRIKPPGIHSLVESNATVLLVQYCNTFH